ncbi:permease [Flavimobilis marinus]|uniref:Inner membrane transporter RhtA n=1 Tax=Flavimobilis marinus TaxID=285351 RepID=A0A1I2CCB1_9MICO|nr:EamA family transporter [Flavimobilis marinus]GHG47925.1 permease [Flavimobilis marinus]SFE65858.1 inner membrane transporter RhtA [Flavimobilis marinus]
MTNPPDGHPTGLGRVPVPFLFLTSGAAQYYGAALAVGLFAVVGAPEVAWLRIAASAVLLLAWRRPFGRARRGMWTRRSLGAAALFGIVLAGMNISFYVALDHLALGTAVAIEFLGPVAVAAVTGRTVRERAAIAVAGLGVVLLAGATLGGTVDGGEPVVGLVAIGVAAACWAGYILLGRRLAVRGDGVTMLAVAMSAGALAFAPVLGPRAITAVPDLSLAAVVVGIAVLSSVVPYALEQVILPRLSAAAFATMLALLPATAALVGALALAQLPSAVEVVGLVCVCGAIIMTAPRRR